MLDAALRRGLRSVRKVLLEALGDQNQEAFGEQIETQKNEKIAFRSHPEPGKHLGGLKQIRLSYIFGRSEFSENAFFVIFDFLQGLQPLFFRQ